MMPTIADSDYRFLDRTRRLLGVGSVSVRWSGLKAKWPDIWCLPAARTITITQEWKRQPIWERRKRIVHEVLHYLGITHGRKGKLMFSTYPAQDTFSKEVYERMKRKNPINPSDKIWIRERELRALPKRTLIGIYKRCYPSASVDATTSKDRLVAGILEATFGRRNPAYNYSQHKQDAELVNLYHLARTALSGKDDSRWARMVWASKMYAKEDPEITQGLAYKKLDRLLTQGNPIIESAITGLGFGAGLLAAKGIMGKVIKNPVSRFRKGDIVRLKADPRRRFVITKAHHIWYSVKEILDSSDPSFHRPKTLSYMDSDLEPDSQIKNPLVPFHMLKGEIRLLKEYPAVIDGLPGMERLYEDSYGNRAVVSRQKSLQERGEAYKKRLKAADRVLRRKSPYRNPVIRTKATNPLLAQLHPGQAFKHQGYKYIVAGGPIPWGRDDVLVPVQMIGSALKGTIPGSVKV